MRTTKRDWLIPATLFALSRVPEIAGTARMAALATGAEVTSENARFFASPLPVLVHVPAAILYSLLGALQFSPAFRRRRRGWHRVAGRILIPAGALVALSGLWMAHFYPWPQGDGQMVYIERLLAGSWMLFSIGMGVNAIRVRDFSRHGDWMIRAYAIGLGAGTQVFTHLPWFILMQERPGELARGVMMGAGWLINWAIAEWVIRKPVRRSTAQFAIVR
jgi:uncharacterized membrane protein